MKRSVCFFALLGLLVFAGCGGGGGDSASDNTGTGVNYTGLTTQAKIDAANAGVLTEDSFSACGLGVTAAGVASAEDPGPSLQDKAKLTPVINLALAVIKRADFSGEASFKASNSASGTINGPCGGQASYTITADTSGAFSGSMSFARYCEDGLTISGTVNLSGTVNVFVYNPYLQSANMTLNVTATDTAAGKVYWARNYTIGISAGTASSFDLTFTGTFYAPDYGYVELSTLTPFHYNYGDAGPCPGVMKVSGSNGTKAKLTSLSSTTYKVEADTDGDDLYDDWVSTTLSW